jgi:hypothetical protein
MKNDLQDVLVLDIETVTAKENFDQLNPKIQDYWKHKSNFIRNDNERDHSELYFERGGIYSEFGKVIVIGVGIFHQTDNGNLAIRIKSFENSDEATLLNEFATFLTEKFDADHTRLCAHNGKEFDFPYLCRRMIVNSIPLPELLDFTGRKPWEIQHLDTMELWKFGDRKNFTSLGLLCEILDIPSSKFEIDGSDVNKVYYNEEDGLRKIARYCRGDVLATAQLLLRINNRPLVKDENITILES